MTTTQRLGPSHVHEQTTDTGPDPITPLMARPTRLELAGAVYCVTAPGNDRSLIFRNDQDRGMYLERLAH